MDHSTTPLRPAIPIVASACTLLVLIIGSNLPSPLYSGYAAGSVSARWS